MNRAVIAVGSNIDPDTNIPKALQLLRPRLLIVQTSSWRRTAPLGYTNQPDFTNGALLIHTPHQQEWINSLLKDIELQCLRVRTTNKNGPRTIDLDVVIWNNTIIDHTVFTRYFLKASIGELYAPHENPLTLQPPC
jgi:2-amino-4-hydroxy-6-hydroxymethyldihydropteridine diphosphokinase